MYSITKYFYFTLCVFLLHLTVVRCRGVWTSKNYPNPQLEPTKCGRPKNSTAWVCDPDGIITYDEAMVLDYKLQAIAHRGATKCPCSASQCERDSSGYKIAIALMNKFHMERGKYTEKKDVVIEAASKFAYDLLMRRWHYGNCEESVVILFSKTDNILYVMSGDTAKVKLSEEKLRIITDHAGPFFAPGKDISVGLKRMVINMRKVFNDNFHRDAIFKKYGRGEATTSTANLLALISCLWVSRHL